jgi:hypothetical protein
VVNRVFFTRNGAASVVLFIFTLIDLLLRSAVAATQ